MSSEVLVLCLTLLLIAALVQVLPQLTRQDLFFGLTIDPAFRSTDAARRIVRGYRLAVWGSALAALAGALAFHALIVPLILFQLGFLSAVIMARRSTRAQALPGRPPVMQINLSAPREHIPGGPVALLLPLVLLAVLGVWALLNPDQLPQRLAAHSGLNGPDRWVDTRWQTVLGLLLVHGFLALIFAGIALGILHASRRIATTGPAAAAERKFRRRSVWLVLTIEYLLILPAFFSLLQAPVLAMQVWTAALLIAVVGFVAGLIRIGQGGTRLAPAQPGTGDRTPDERWIGGLIYFNRSDPALWVERRFGLGWTFNFANPWSWAIIVALAAVPALLRHVFL